MNETKKLQNIRKSWGHFDRYFQGRGIDIGCGPDCLEGAEPFDRELGHGDAQLMSNIPDETYDYVYSSHCLEHMRDIPETIKNWCRILKVGGWMYIVVPEYIYYEKCTWPPKFNLDHKHSFLIGCLENKLGGIIIGTPAFSLDTLQPMDLIQ